MANPEFIVASAGGWCRGADTTAPFSNQVLFSVNKGSGGITSVDCPVYSRSTSLCEKAGLPCVWTVFESEELPSPELSCMTPAGALILDTSEGTILKAPHLPEGHDPVSTTLLESELLETLMRRQGIVVTRTQLAHSAPYRLSDKSVTVNLARLRSKIGENKDTRQPALETVRGRGYRIAKAPRT